ncbi:MAG: hypothetical protein Q8M31_05410 [Beijerinckiaceae bacterium]|nr:hypothetical protein [Beijerinckiaceae bacterium]
MGQRTIEFVEQWVLDNVPPGPHVDERGVDLKVKELAKQLLEVAREKRSISLEEIEADVGNLDVYIARAINRSADGAASPPASKSD